MAKNTIKTSDNLKSLMWERLSESPENLDLDRRAEEEPEDLFVRLCNTGRKKDVISALKANLCETIGNIEGKEKGAALRFMQRAIRLCDIIGAYNCKPFLEMLLLHNRKDYWGEDLEELQELASRTLSGMPKDASDYSYWSRIADKLNTSISYALNAMIEIDIEEGLKSFIGAYNFCHEHKRLKEVNWNVLIEIAIDTHGKKKICKALYKIFKDKPEYYEWFVHHFGLRELSKIKERSISDFMSYSKTLSTVRKKEINIDNLLGYSQYKMPQSSDAFVDLNDIKEKMGYGVITKKEKIQDELSSMKEGYPVWNTGAMQEN